MLNYHVIKGDIHNVVFVLYLRVRYIFVSLPNKILFMWYILLSRLFVISSCSITYHRMLQTTKYRNPLCVWTGRSSECIYASVVSKIRQNIYRADKLLLGFTVNSDIYSPLFQIKLHLLNTVLLSGFQSSPNFEIHWVRQYLLNFMALASMISANVYKTEPIFTGLGTDKLS